MDEFIDFGFKASTDCENQNVSHFKWGVWEIYFYNCSEKMVLQRGLFEIYFESAKAAWKWWLTNRTLIKLQQQ